MPTQPNAIMLFAAGFGTRMQELTKDRPKPLIKVAGTALIDHALAMIADAHIGKTVVNTHYLPQMMATHLAGKNVTISHETEILETGGGLRHALPLLGQGPVFTLNSDAVWRGQNPLKALANAWDPDKMDALLLLIPPENTLGHTGNGDFEISNTGALTRSPGLVYSGAQIIKTDRLHDIDQTRFSLNVLWNEMIRHNRVFGHVYDGKWCDVGSPQGIETAEKMLKGAHV
ncbi:MAG: nucleotidyltransferase [Rhodobacterales bacterium]|nr:MAG: nucleotidyltransferase [Rhodobacterales bacterium]